MCKEEFKKFVRNNPNLVNYLINKKMTWQQFYEMFDLYGENSDIWNNFKNDDNNNSLKDLFSMFKGIDLKSVQKTLLSINKALEAFKSNNVDNQDIHPDKYKYFED